MLLEAIETKLHNAFAPVYLQVVNESYMHNVPAGSESHFKVIVVSREFEGLRLLERHKRVNQALVRELEDGLHALSIHTYTEQEWKAKNEIVPQTPKCAGGSKK